MKHFRIRLVFLAIFDHAVAGFFSFVGGDFLFPAAAARFVKNEVASDGEEVGRELGLGLVAFGVFPDAEEYLLGDVFGIGRISQHLRDRAYHEILVALDQLTKRLFIAFADSSHESMIEHAFIVIRRCRWLLHGQNAGD